MSRYQVWDRGLVLARVAGWLVCPAIGHRWKRKMHGSVCKRCNTYQARPR